MTGWDDQDLRALHQIGAGLGAFRVIKIEENSMTDQAPESVWDGEDAQEAPAFGGATYPEYPYSLADHVYTWSPKLPDGSMLVIRAQTAEGLAEAAEAAAAVTGRLAAAWRQATGAPQAPQGFPQQSQPNYNPVTPPPNQPYPGQPAWQQAGAPAPQAPAWGGQQVAPQGQQQRKEYPAPQGWYKLNVPFPNGKDQLHALAQQAGIMKGNPSKGGMYNFFGLTPSGQPGKAWYCAPQVAQAFAQFSPVAA